MALIADFLRSAYWLKHTSFRVFTDQRSKVPFLSESTEKYLMITRLFKYVKLCTALTILKNKTLRWSAPDLFNDPFEFKSPLEILFEWDDLKEPVLERLSTIVTQLEDPILVSGNPVAPIIAEARKLYRGKDPAVVRSLIEVPFQELIKTWKKIWNSDIWLEMKQDYRVLCVSSVHDDILMWSHYAEEHRGAVLEFRPIIELGTATLAARPVEYSKDVHEVRLHQKLCLGLRERMENSRQKTD
jgi:hypothetical protein